MSESRVPAWLCSVSGESPLSGSYKAVSPLAVTSTGERGKELFQGSFTSVLISFMRDLPS